MSGGAGSATRAPPGRPARRGRRFGGYADLVLIDLFLPPYDVSEEHAVLVAAPADRVWAGIRGIDLSRSPIVRALFTARGVPALLAGNRRGRRGLTLEDFLRSGFVLLAEEPEVELVLGAVGSFWRPRGGLLRLTPAGFAGSSRPGYARAAWNGHLAPDGEGHVRVSTLTRVGATDDRSLRSFRRYWRLIRPSSGLIRREMLRLVKDDAEAGRGAGVGREGERPAW